MPYSLVVFSLRFAIIFVLLLSTLACGGSSGSSDPDAPAPSPEPLLVNAGVNLTLNENESSNIIGGSSGGIGAITYAWQADERVQINHSDTSQTNANLIAPTTTEIEQFQITLFATDTSGQQQSDSITLTVNPLNLPPIAIINSNQIEGYNPQEYPSTSTISLDASASTDNDPQTNNAAITEYRWQQITGPSMLAGIDTSQVLINLVTPALEQSSQAQFRLSVTDQEQSTTTADITVTLLSQAQTIPRVEINPIKQVFSGELVHLVAIASSLAPRAAPFTALWSADQLATFIAPTQLITAAVSPLVRENSMVKYQVMVDDSFGNVVSTIQSVEVYAPVPQVFNDTGITQFANSQANSTQYQRDYPGQDAAYGADRQTASGQIIKVGDGEQGFDFTRLDNSGDAVENASFAFSCVRDNVTGLVWQTKNNTDNTNINYVDQQFTWFADEENGNFEGGLNPNSTSCNQSNGQCNTQDYAQTVNAQGLCGFFDWRLPTPTELQSIVHYGKASPPMVDTTFFPFWGSSNDGPLWYWTSQSSADGVSDDIARNAWAFDMNTGNDGFVNKLSEQRIILVRAGR